MAMRRALSLPLRAVVSVLAALCALPALADRPRIEVFTISTLPVSNAGDAAVYRLDAVALLEQHLSAELPADPARAQAIVNQRMATLGPQLEARVREGATGLARATQLGLQRAPVIVFDGQWAVYGVTDVDAARRLFLARRR